MLKIHKDEDWLGLYSEADPSSLLLLSQNQKVLRLSFCKTLVLWQKLTFITQLLFAREEKVSHSILLLEVFLPVVFLCFSFFLSLHSRVAGRSHHYGLFVLLNSYCQYLRKNPLNKPNEVASEHENYSNVCHCFHYSSLHITNRKLFYFNVIQIKYVSSYSNVLELN